MNRDRIAQAQTFRLYLASLPHLFDCAPGGSALPPTTDHRPPTTDHRQPTTDNRPPSTVHRPPSTDNRQPTSDLSKVALHRRGSTPMNRDRIAQAQTFRLYLASLPHLFDCAPGGSALPPTTVHRPPTTDHRPPTTDNRQPTTDHRPPTTDLCPLKFENNPADLTIKVFQLILPS
jgi:hypothetical protein